MELDAELAAALQSLLEQAYQMRGMFSDDDGAIGNAILDAESALESHRKARAMRPKN
jgi:hypothetical protein